MFANYAVSALLTLFVVVDPVGLVPTFLAVTEGLPRRSRRSVAVLQFVKAAGRSSTKRNGHDPNDRSLTPGFRDSYEKCRLPRSMRSCATATKRMTVSSQDADASVSPSGLNATAVAGAGRAMVFSIFPETVLRTSMTFALASAIYTKGKAFITQVEAAAIAINAAHLIQFGKFSVVFVMVISFSGVSLFASYLPPLIQARNKGRPSNDVYPVHSTVSVATIPD